MSEPQHRMHNSCRPGSLCAPRRPPTSGVTTQALECHLLARQDRGSGAQTRELGWSVIVPGRSTSPQQQALKSCRRLIEGASLLSICVSSGDPGCAALRSSGQAVEGDTIRQHAVFRRDMSGMGQVGSRIVPLKVCCTHSKTQGLAVCARFESARVFLPVSRHCSLSARVILPRSTWQTR